MAHYTHNQPPRTFLKVNWVVIICLILLGLLGGFYVGLRYCESRIEPVKGLERVYWLE